MVVALWMCLGKTCINSTRGSGLSLSPVSVSTENNAICIWGVGFVLGKHALGIHPSPRWAVATSLGISLSHMRESKVVHVLLGACWLTDQGGDGQWWEDRRKLRWFWKNQMPPVSIKCPLSPAEKEFAWRPFPYSGHASIIHVTRLQWITLKWWRYKLQFIWTQNKGGKILVTRKIG